MGFGGCKHMNQIGTLRGEQLAYSAVPVSYAKALSHTLGASCISVTHRDRLHALEIPQDGQV